MIDIDQIRNRLETWKAMSERAKEMYNRIGSNDQEGEHACFHCETERELRQCNTCNGQAYIIDCAHYEQPAYISWCHEEDAMICDDCHFDKEEEEEVTND